MSSPSAENGFFPGVPVGFRFIPSAHDIVQGYLAKKVSGEEIARSPIMELDIFKFEPEELPITNTYERTRWMYFFVFMTENNMDHSTPNGFWMIDKEDVPIKDELTNEVVGFKNSFVYYTNELGPNKRYKTNWVMDEYRTHGLENPNDPLMKNWMVCKIESPIPREVVKKVIRKRRGRRGRRNDKNIGVNLYADGAGDEACNV